MENSPSIGGILNLPEYVSNETIFNPVKTSDIEGRLAVRSKIEAAQKALQNIAGNNTGDRDLINNNGLTELFIGGSYIRRLVIPKDTAIVSELWNKARYWIIVSGEVSFISETGAQRIKGPYDMVAPYGSKIALYTHEETTWFAITGTSSTESSEVEKELITHEYELS